MKRARLKQIAEVVAADAASKGYDHWLANASDAPISFTKDIDGRKVNVEIQVLERTEDFVQLGVSADDSGFLSSRFPPGITVLVRRSDPRGIQE